MRAQLWARTPKTQRFSLEAAPLDGPTGSTVTYGFCPRACFGYAAAGARRSALECGCNAARRRPWQPEDEKGRCLPGTSSKRRLPIGGTSGSRGPMSAPLACGEDSSPTASWSRSTTKNESGSYGLKRTLPANYSNPCFGKSSARGSPAARQHPFPIRTISGRAHLGCDRRMLACSVGTMRRLLNQTTLRRVRELHAALAHSDKQE